MSSITLLGDTSGSIVIDAPAIAGNGTLTLPTGTATLAINGPAFSAYPNTSQTLSTDVSTKLLFQLEEWDTNSCYNTSNSRFTPNVAGYYFIQGSMQAAVSWTGGRVMIFKNGSEAKVSNIINSGAGDTGTFSSSATIYCNGSTDYIELYGLLGIGQAITASQVATWFQGHMVRAA